MVITGSQGILRVKYQSAAEFRDWCLTADQEILGKFNSTLRGKIVQFHSGWIKQQPLTMELCLDTSIWWIWDDITLLDSSDLKQGGIIELYTESNPTVR